MCIRDRDGGAADHQRFNYDVLEGILDAYQKGTAYSCAVAAGRAPNGAESTYFPCTVSADFTGQGARDIIACLLYTSDAADDLLCVDVGGRRIPKKKKKKRCLLYTI